MTDAKKSKESLISDITALRQRIGNLEKLEEQHKKLENELLQCAERYHILFDNAEDALFVHGVTEEGLFSTFTEVNETACRLLGYSREELFEMKPSNILYEEEGNRDANRKKVQELIKKKHAILEGTFVAHDGKKIQMELNCHVFELDKKVTILSIARDISERKRIEEMLRQNKEELEKQVEEQTAEIRASQELLKKAEADKAMILSSIMEHVIYHDPKSKIIWANDAAARSLNMMPEQLIGEHCYELWQQRKSVCPGCPVQEAIQSGKAQIAEMTTPDGRIWLIRGYPVRDEDNNIIGAVEVTFDVTVIRQADEALRESEERYKALTDNLNVGIYRNTIGPRGKFIEANPAVIRMFGYRNKEEFLEIDVAELYQDPIDREKFNKKILHYGFVREEELYLKKKDGTLFYGSVSAVAVKDEQGEVQYFDGIVYDITERKNAEDELQQSYMKLKRVLNGTVNALASTTEKRDPYTAGHQHRVAQLACAIAHEMGLSEEEIEGIRVAAIVHDIGKIYVAAEILNKPVKLKEIEMALIKAHCQAGYDILKTVDFPWPVAKMVLQHHEKLDGSGYPQGLKDQEIILGAKILAVADVVEAMLSHRPYRSALSVDEALHEIRENRGRLYAPAVVDACERVIQDGFIFK